MSCVVVYGPYMIAYGPYMIFLDVPYTPCSHYPLLTRSPTSCSKGGALMNTTKNIGLRPQQYLQVFHAKKIWLGRGRVRDEVQVGKRGRT